MNPLEEHVVLADNAGQTADTVRTATTHQPTSNRDLLTRDAFPRFV